MDQFARFNPRLIYASEGGKTIGTPTPAGMVLFEQAAQPRYKTRAMTQSQRDCLEGK